MKRFLILAAALFSAAAAHAQIGIVGGIASPQSNISSAIDEVESITQYHLGIAFKVQLFGNFMLQPGILYNIKGTQLGGARTDEFSVDMKTGFLEVPVQLQYGFSAGSFRPFLFAEPYVGYAITNETKTTITENLTSTVKKDSSTNWDNVKDRLEYGVGLGAGIEIFERLQIAVKYYWDMGRLYDENMKVNTKLSDITTNIKQNTCTGIAATATIFF